MLYVYADDKLIYNSLDESLIIAAPHLTLERGKAGSFQFGLPPNNKYYDAFQKLKTKVSVEIDDTEIFRGRILSESKDLYNVRTIYCEGDLAYLVDSVQKGEKYVGTTHALFQKIVTAHNAQVDEDKRFEIGIIEIEDREIILTGQSGEITDIDSENFDYKQIAINSITNEWKTTYDYIENCLIDTCGGYLRTRRDGDHIYLDLLTNSTDDVSQRIEFGLNLLDLTEEVSAENLFTVLIPLGDDNLTIESINNGSCELVDAEMAEVYGRIVKTHVFENVNQPSTLMENGQRFLANHANIPATITIRAVDMHLLDKQIPLIKIGDSVPVKSKPHNIVRNLVCTKIEYDFENLGNCTFVFGTIQESLTERYRKDKNKTSGSGASGDGAVGSAAEEAANRVGDKLYDAWINVDPETGHIDLGTLYEEYNNTITVLRNTCGIDIDAPNGNINIKNLKMQCDDQGKEILNQNARIELINDDTHAQIDLVVSRVNTVEDLESAHYATISMRCDDLESAIDMTADRVTVEAMQITLDAHASRLQNAEEQNAEAKATMSALSETTNELGERLSANDARITTLSDSTKSEITAVATRTTETETKLASLEIRVTDTESDIELKADKTTINSKLTTITGRLDTDEADIKTLKSNYAEVKQLIADEIDAMKGNVDWLNSKSISVGVVKADYSIWVGDSMVATRKWVQEQLESYAQSSHAHTWSEITGKPTYFTPTKHRHSFAISQKLANGHTHKVVVDGTTYTSLGVSTNTQHSLDISDYTGYTGGSN